MPLVDFAQEFHHRYIKDSPMVSWKGSPFFPNDIYQEDTDTFVISGYYIEKTTMKKRQTTFCLDNESLCLRFPEIGWLNVDSRTCVYFSIDPVKQWRFALTQNTCNIFNPLSAEYAQTKTLPVNPSLLWTSKTKGKRVAYALWNRKYYSIRKAYELLAVKKTHVGAAFSQDFALIAHKGKRYPVLYYKKYPIGYTPNHKTVCVPGHMNFMRELLQEYFLNVEEINE